MEDVSFNYTKPFFLLFNPGGNSYGYLHNFIDYILIRWLKFNSAKSNDLFFIKRSRIPLFLAQRIVLFDIIYI